MNRQIYLLSGEDIDPELQQQQLAWVDLLIRRDIPLSKPPPSINLNKEQKEILSALWFKNGLAGVTIDYPQTSFELWCYMVSCSQSWALVFTLACLIHTCAPFMQSPVCPWEQSHSRGYIDIFRSRTDGYVPDLGIICIYIVCAVIYLADAFFSIVINTSGSTLIGTLRKIASRNRWVLFRLFSSILILADVFTFFGHRRSMRYSVCLVPLIYISRRTSMQRIMEGMFIACYKSFFVYFAYIGVLVMWGFLGYIVFQSIQLTDVVLADGQPFSTFQQSLLTVLLCLTSRSYNLQTMAPYFRITESATIFFCSLLVIGDVLISNLVIAVGNRQFRLYAARVFNRQLRNRKQAIVAIHELLSASDGLLSRESWLGMCRHITGKNKLTDITADSLFEMEAELIATKNEQGDYAIDCIGLFRLCALLGNNIEVDVANVPRTYSGIIEFDREEDGSEDDHSLPDDVLYNRGFELPSMMKSPEVHTEYEEYSNGIATTGPISPVTYDSALGSGDSILKPPAHIMSDSNLILSPSYENTFGNSLLAGNGTKITPSRASSSNSTRHSERSTFDSSIWAGLDRTPPIKHDSTHRSSDSGHQGSGTASKAMRKRPTTSDSIQYTPKATDLYITMSAPKPVRHRTADAILFGKSSSESVNALTPIKIARNNTDESKNGESKNDINFGSAFEQRQKAQRVRSGSNMSGGSNSSGRSGRGPVPTRRKSASCDGSHQNPDGDGGIRPTRTPSYNIYRASEESISKTVRWGVQEEKFGDVSTMVSPAKSPATKEEEARSVSVNLPLRCGSYLMTVMVSQWIFSIRNDIYDLVEYRYPVAEYMTSNYGIQTLFLRYMPSIHVFACWFNFIRLLIGVKVAMMSWNRLGAEAFEAWKIVEVILLIMMWVEMVLLIIAYGFPSYIRRTGFGYVFVINVAALILTVFNLVADKPADERFTNAFYAMMIVGAIRLLRFFTFLPGASVFIHILPLFLRIVLVIFSIIYFFAVFAHMRFCNSLEPERVQQNTDAAGWLPNEGVISFSSLAYSILALFEISVLGNWTPVMSAAAEKDIVESKFFFILYRLIMSMVVIPLLLAFVISAFISKRDSDEKKNAMEKRDTASMSTADAGKNHMSGKHEYHAVDFKFYRAVQAYEETGGVVYSNEMHPTQSSPAKYAYEDTLRLPPRRRHSLNDLRSMSSVPLSSVVSLPRFPIAPGASHSTTSNMMAMWGQSAGVSFSPTFLKQASAPPAAPSQQEYSEKNSTRADSEGLDHLQSLRDLNMLQSRLDAALQDLAELQSKYNSLSGSKSPTPGEEEGKKSS
jgi:hypothetical protein